ncbi:hypothetical protein QAD02_008637 [Eretmocerus hayati]|uniref:Uncharacterized protein n=1 Tax=Eretmocerus hayati TaxID=131215 RepID=A0ACC2NBI2_9HYME|nr:hypothetical protein QAD02_008637 [Eretmocerus hayati]
MADGDQGLSRHTSRIVVINCPSVTLTNHSLVQMEGLLSVDLLNISNLTLSSYSLKLHPKASKVRVTLRNASVDIIPSNLFHGDVEAIVLDSLKVGQVSAFAFANLVNTNSITLENCQIEAVEALAFKKFDVKFLHVIGGSLGKQLPSRAMNDIEVYDKFMLDGVKIGMVRSSAFVISKPKTVAIHNCEFDSVESEAFDVSVRGTVLIKNNTFGHVAFGAFFSIRSDPENRATLANPYSLMFKNNVLGSFEDGSLVFDRTSFRAELANILVNQACDCDQLTLWKSQILNYTNAHSRLIVTREDSDILVPAFSLESSVDDPETFLCLDDSDSGATLSFVEYESRHCTLNGSMTFLVLSMSGLLTLLMLTACLVVYCCRKRRGEEEKRWISVPTSAPDIVAKNKNGVIGRDTTAGAAPVDSRITMVVPDGRLYRETEFHVIVEKAEPLTTEL